MNLEELQIAVGNGGSDEGSDDETDDDSGGSNDDRDKTGDPTCSNT